MSRLNIKSLHSNQDGIVSLVVTVILLVIVSLITLGFARLANREQRQSLDRVLSTQAYYAAEAGINDAVKFLRTPNPATYTKDNCDFDDSFPDTSQQYDKARNVGYSCILVDKTPPSLEYSDIGLSSSMYIPIESKSGSNLSSITISWQPIGSFPSQNFAKATKNDFPPLSNWKDDYGDTGVLRASLTPNSGSFTRDDLISKTFTGFFYPNVGGSNQVDYDKDPINQGQIVKGKCDKNNSPKYCSVTINIKPAVQSNKYMLRLRSIYKDSAVTITATDVNSNRVAFINAQALVDSTGYDQDVLRRLQVRIQLRKPYTYPEDVVESGDAICKRLLVANNYWSVDTSAVATSPVDDTPACQPN